MRSLLFLCVILFASCAACQKTVPEKRYDLRGEVIKLDAANQIASIKHDKIGDWMDAMTMEFPVKPKQEFDQLAVGDQITGTVIVRGMEYQLTDIKTVSKLAGPAK